MVTIKQVAQKAGLSKSTVSRYISHNGYVSEEAREKIKRAIESLHYRPNVIAQSLKTKKSQLVGLLLPDITNPFFPRLARGAEVYLQEKGYRLILGNISDSHTLEEEYIKVLLQSNAAGIITTHDFTKNYPDLEIPVVVVDRVDKDTKYGVFSDSYAGGQLAAEIICQTKSQKILLIKGPLDMASNINDRFQANLDCLKSYHKTIQVCESKSFDFDLIQEEARKNLDKYADIDSVIAPSDIHAIAYIHELHARGKKIPEEVQIIGYDDILMSQFIYPSLSTIHQSSYQMGHYAAELIHKIANQIPIEENRIKLPVHYVERETIRRRINE
ncbi:LacI family DNA-binding transcriptional regulator [Streptococcus didelphis]|uniref:LacI family DNA-binding transcriptional regulator n=1 Tax=Streptococcus didelphis TaxID=102886 RepID=UPI0003702BE7|nr:LacI family DNA-binding transcriptional regulator [Streptococcus didelphis]